MISSGSQLLSQIRQALRRSRVVALIGPRQCDKTTLARQIEPADSARDLDFLVLARSLPTYG
jgi:predicted AAA+ superfamily ATPase